MNILFIGGTGVISSACTEAALQAGHNVYLLNRGQSVRKVPEGAVVLRGDIRDEEAASRLIGTTYFDVVVNWIAYVPEHVETDIRLFRGQTGQYIFISSASAYETPPSRLPVTEETPLYNPFWEYSRNKIACEVRLVEEYRSSGFPVTIVRPSHTYDRTMLPLHGGYTVVDRMRNGKPVVVHGDGSSLWTLTHHQDFARGFIGVLGNPDAIGEAIHITSDEVLTWNQIYMLVARAFRVEPVLIHVPSDLIAAYDPHWGASLLGDKTHCMVFDNTKIKRLVPGFQATITFEQGVQEYPDWFDGESSRRTVDPVFDAIIDRIVTGYLRARPEE